MAIADNIRSFRKQKGLTQKKLGELCKPKIGESTIRKYELGLLNPKIETIEKIALALDVRTIDILNPKDFLHLSHEEDKEFDILISRTAEIEFKKTIDSFINSTNGRTIISAYSYLNKEGQEKAIERVAELTEIPKYQREIINVMAGTKAVMNKVDIETNATFEMPTDDDKKEE